MNIILFAVTGRAGTAILNELINRQIQVTAIARDITKLPENLPDSVQVIANNFTDANKEQIIELIADADVIISAFGPSSKDPRYISDIRYTDQLVGFTQNLIDTVQTLNKQQRLIVVGGAGSLYFSPGITVLDSGHWPQQYIPIATSHIKAYTALKQSNINWTYFSPPILIKPGERTGQFRLGQDDLIKDQDGNSSISFEDYAVALVNEIEQPFNERKRFTIGY